MTNRHERSVGERFKPGDLVLCVEDMDHPVSSVSPIVRGRAYRVLDVGPGLSRSTGKRDPYAVSVKQDDLTHGAVWWSSSFRHLPKADEQFTEQMRALRPVRTPATLTAERDAWDARMSRNSIMKREWRGE